MAATSGKLRFALFRIRRNGDHGNAKQRAKKMTTVDR
jgi:hypothetical protein